MNTKVKRRGLGLSLFVNSYARLIDRIASSITKNTKSRKAFTKNAYFNSVQKFYKYKADFSALYLKATYSLFLPAKSRKNAYSNAVSCKRLKRPDAPPCPASMSTLNNNLLSFVL